MNKNKILARKIDAAIEAYKSHRLRWVLGISQVGISIDQARYYKVINDIMRDEIERHMIIGALGENRELSAYELTQITGISPSQMIHHIIALRKNRVITEAGQKDHEYLYKLIL